MLKSELKNGMVVEYRNGDRRMVINGLILGLNTRNKLDFYNDNLNENLKNDDLDIVKVYNVLSSVVNLEDCFNQSNLILVWERPQTKRVFRMWKYVEEALQRNNGRNLKGSFKIGWVQDCEGLTVEEIQKKDKFLQVIDAWLVEEPIN